MAKSPKIVLAKTFSVIGHPLLTISLLVIYLSFKQMNSNDAWITCLIIIGGVTLPVILNNLWKTYKGTYSNFDVSNPVQRNGFFLFAIGLMLVITVVCWITHRPLALIYSMLLFNAMLLLFYIINKKWKLSLHAAINFYVSAVLFHYDHRLGFLIFLLAIMVAISRVLLKRHTVLEIILGGLLGLLTGIINGLFF